MRPASRVKGFFVLAGGSPLGRRSGASGVLVREERADDELARLNQTYLAADLLDDADVLVAHRCRPVDRLDAAVGPEVRAAHAGEWQSDDGVRRFDNRRVGALLGTHVSGAVKNCSSHDLSPSE